MLKKFLIIFFVTMIVFSFSIQSNSISWYFKKNTNHKQPILEENLKIIEKYNGYWCDKNHAEIDDKKKIIYLTFDAGYENGNIEKILDILKEEKVNGNFFILSNLILNNENLVKRMIDEGHTIGNHTSKHKDMTKLKTKEDFKNELEKLENIYKNKFGVEMEKFYRPPEGKFSEENLMWASELGYKTVFWSFAYQDWDNNNQINEEIALKKILENIHNGEVILFHPTSSTNANIMKRLIKELKKQGFEFGDLNELCKDTKKNG